MSSSRLPLNALRAFEAAARLGSMTAAAAELGVTHGAVSRHVKTLEEQYGTTLLRRLPHAVATTAEGGQLAANLAEAFQLIHSGIARLRPAPLTLSCSATIMMYWLIPRLEEFKRGNPDIDLRLNVNYGSVDFGRDEVSLAIRNSMIRPPQDVVTRRLIDEEIGPVCHPDTAARLDLKRPADLARGRILASATRPSAWLEWAAAAGERGLVLEPCETYEHFYLVIQAAACGLGIALAPRILVESEIRTGHLVAPFGFRPGPHHLTLWIAPHLRTRPDLRRVAAWLNGEMRASLRARVPA